MPAKNKTKQSKELKKHKINSICNSNLQTLMRLKQNVPPSMTKEELDLTVIDITLKELFNDGDKVVKDFKSDILTKYNIYHDEKTLERFWDILDATNLVNPVVGFGNSNKLSLSTEGYNLMLKFGSYRNFVNAMNQAMMPQAIVPPGTVQQDNSKDEHNHTEVSSNE